ncbi:TPA: hypothetical protein ACM93N_002574 [Escherichia coli]
MSDQHKGPKPNSNTPVPSQSGNKSPKINQQDTVKYDTKGTLDPKRINESRDSGGKK